MKRCIALFLFCYLILPASGSIPYDVDLAVKLASASYSFKEIHQIRGEEAAEKGLNEQKLPQIVDLPLAIDGSAKYDQGETDACTFFARVCGMLMTDRGRAQLQSLFLGQDDTFVYIKFPTPTPFGAVDLDGFLRSLREKKVMHTQGFESVAFLQKTILKVHKSVIFEHKPLDGFVDSPAWFRILAAAYHDVYKSFVFCDGDEELCTGDSQVCFGYLESRDVPRKNTDIEILTGKDQLTDLDIREAFANKVYPLDFHGLLHKPLLNFRARHPAHVRAICISEENVRIFDSDGDGLVLSKMFDSRVSLDLIHSIIEKTKLSVAGFWDAEEELRKGMNPDELDHRALMEQVFLKRVQCLQDIEDNTKTMIPTYDDYSPIRIDELTQDEFYARLYAELINGCFLGLRVFEV